LDPKWIAFHIVKLTVDDFGIGTLFNKNRFVAVRKNCIGNDDLIADSAFNWILLNIRKFAAVDEQS
jgi:hypothetical protein